MSEWTAIRFDFVREDDISSDFAKQSFVKVRSQASAWERVEMEPDSVSPVSGVADPGSISSSVISMNGSTSISQLVGTSGRHRWNAYDGLLD